MRSIEGLTTKVLNERLRKLVGYGFLQRRAFPEIPPRVEYQLTEFGERLTGVLKAIENLDAAIAQQPPTSKQNQEDSDGKI